MANQDDLDVLIASMVSAAGKSTVGDWLVRLADYEMDNGSEAFVAKCERIAARLNAEE